MPPRPLAPLLFMLLLAGPGSACVSGTPDPDEPPPFLAPPRPPAGAYTRDALLRLTDAQVKGTHNSYHLEPASPVADSHRYSQPTLGQQLERDGVRQIELDLHYRIGVGFEVFHLPLLDPETTCLALTDCLTTVLAWSLSRPFHFPLLVWLEPKDEDADALDPDLVPLLGRWAELEETLREALGRGRIVAASDVRGDAATLGEAMQESGWPTLAATRGKVIFALLDRESRRADYLTWAETQDDPLIFPATESLDEPWAALAKLDDAVGDPRVEEFLAAGLLVTSNAGGAGDTAEVQGADWENSLLAGAHFVSTDFPAEGGAFWAQVPDGAPARCNPVTAPAECEPADLEVEGGAAAE